MSESRFPLRLALVSATGTAFKRTLPALEGDPTFEVVGAQGRSTEKLRTISRRYPSVPIFTDIEEMLEQSQPDVVFVGSPPHLHRDQISTVLPYCRRILCEKPLVDDLLDGISLLESEREFEATIRVAQHLRCQQASQYIRKAVESGTYGRPLAVRARWHFPLNVDAANAKWKVERDKGVGSMLDVGIHCVDAIEYLLGKPKSLGCLTTHERGMSASLSYRLEQDILASVSTSWAGEARGNDLEIRFEEATVIGKGYFGERSCPSIRVESTRNEVQEHKFQPESLYRNEMVSFAGLVDGGAQSALPTIASALRSLFVILDSPRSTDG